MAIAALVFATAVVSGQGSDVFVESRDHGAIEYSAGTVADPVATLNRRLQDGSVQLQFDPISGYLRSVLAALKVPIESQLLVFSKTSFQASLIEMHNPRAVYFGDNVAVGWVRGGDVLEVSALDPRQGVIFYTLDQEEGARPQLARNDQCLSCHLRWETLGVPGLIAMSTFPLQDDRLSYANGFMNDHRSPFPERWGGWYVTGDPGGARHMGNVGVLVADRARTTITNPLAARPSVEGLFDLTGYPTPNSDVAPLMLLSHQARATNLLIRAGWEARVAEGQGDAAAARVRQAATELADYLLFVDEVPLVRPMRSTAGFPEAFAAQGPADSRGRSLRQMDLTRRMMRFPLSYMIYSEAFDALPAAARDVVYQRLWDVLSGSSGDRRFGRLTLADRQAAVDILRETKKDLPAYFQPVTR
jgi:hypothetical protein